MLHLGVQPWKGSSRADGLFGSKEQGKALQSHMPHSVELSSPSLPKRMGYKTDLHNNAV